VPKQVLGAGVEDIDNDVADLRNFGGSCGKASSAESPPAPAAAESIVECLEGLLILCAAKRADCGVAVGINLGPPLCGELSIHVLLDSAVPQRIAGLNLNPGISLVGCEVGAVVVIGLDLRVKRCWTKCLWSVRAA
jgi:hypothetical protein